MPTKKDASAALAQNLGAGGTPEATTEKPKKTPKAGPGTVRESGGEQGPGLPPGQAQVVASLVAQGFSYNDAVAMLSGNGTTAPQGNPVASSKEELYRIKKLAEGDDSDLPPVEDVEEKFVVQEVNLGRREGFKTLLDDLWTRREELADVPKKTLYRVTFDIPAAEFDWLLHRTISEGQARKDAEYSVQAALVLLLKQQKALDPTRGGRRQFGGSGPRDAYNPQVGGWTK